MVTAPHFDFVRTVVAERDLEVTNAADHVCRLEPRESDLAWYCDLDDGTPTGENDPASSVRWVCPALRIEETTVGTSIPLIDVRRSGPQSDLGKLAKGFWRLAGRASKGTAQGDLDGRFVYADPTGILDAALRRRIENWPLAQHDDPILRPAELCSIKRTREGLVVLSVSWWGSAPALDHQIGLAVDIARRMLEKR